MQRIKCKAVTWPSCPCEVSSIGSGADAKQGMAWDAAGCAARQGPRVLKSLQDVCECKMYASALRCTALQEPAEALAPAWAAARLGWRVTSHVFTAHGMGTLRAPRGSACPASGTSSVQEAEGLGGGLERLPKRLDTDQGGDGEESQKVLTAACFRSCCPALP